ncbi:hypothetical protein BJ508DRAFT_376996 [Ascobolus immersus RN42]|uniref:Uncharacterized protein n=1 Tax=Ascobolus immersus RN42 TaxID=1160509 RepID=A0A3N4I8X1_ASCIM|nr:hypothetical protein BJ508DRAFT_376996 [Ascobolus immersus RN42]
MTTSSPHPRFPPEKTRPPVQEWSNPPREKFQRFSRHSKKRSSSSSKSRPPRPPRSISSHSNMPPFLSEANQTSPTNPTFNSNNNSNGFSNPPGFPQSHPPRGPPPPRAAPPPPPQNVNGYMPPPHPKRQKRHHDHRRHSRGGSDRKTPLVRPPIRLIDDYNDEVNADGIREFTVPERAAQDVDLLPTIELDGVVYRGTDEDPVPSFIRARFQRGRNLWRIATSLDGSIWRLPKCGIWACKQGVIADDFDRQSGYEKENSRLEAPMTWEQRKEEDLKMWREIREKNRLEGAGKVDDMTGKLVRGGDAAMGGRESRGLDYDETYDDGGEYEDDDTQEYEEFHKRFNGRRDRDDSRANNNDGRGYDDDDDEDDREEDYDRNRRRESKSSYNGIPAAYIEDLAAEGDLTHRDDGHDEMRR